MRSGQDHHHAVRGTTKRTFIREMHLLVKSVSLKCREIPGQGQTLERHSIKSSGCSFNGCTSPTPPPPPSPNWSLLFVLINPDSGPNSNIERRPQCPNQMHLGLGAPPPQSMFDLDSLGGLVGSLCISIDLWFICSSSSSHFIHSFVPSHPPLPFASHFSSTLRFALFQLRFTSR